MANIDVGFKLFADATQLERGLVRSKAAINDMDSRVKGVQKTIGAFGRIAGPAMAIAGVFIAGAKNAQALREEAERSGKAIGDNVSAAARLGDTFDRVTGGIKKGLSVAVGFVTRQVEDLVYRAARLDPKAFRAELAAREAAGKFAADAKKTDEAIAKLKKDAAFAEKDSIGKVNDLLADNLALQKEMDGLGETDVKRNAIKKQIAENFLRIGAEEKKILQEQLAIAEKEAALRNEMLDMRKQETAEIRKANALRQAAAQRVTGAQQNLQQSAVDASKMSLSELASVGTFSPGVSTDLVDAGRGARDAIDLEQKAEGARRRGDQQAAQDFAAQALEKRKSLGGFLRANDANPMASLEQAVANAQAEQAEVEAETAPVAGKATAPAAPGPLRNPRTGQSTINGVPVAAPSSVNLINGQPVEASVASRVSTINGVPINRGALSGPNSMVRSGSLADQVRDAVVSGSVGGDASGAGARGGGAGGGVNKEDSANLKAIKAGIDSINEKFGGVASGPSGS